MSSYLSGTLLSSDACLVLFKRSLPSAKYQPATPRGPGAHSHSPLCRAWHQPASPQGRGAPGTHTAAPRPALCLEPVTHLSIAILPASLPQHYMWINCSVYVHIYFHSSCAEREGEPKTKRFLRRACMARTQRACAERVRQGVLARIVSLACPDMWNRTCLIAGHVALILPIRSWYVCPHQHAHRSEVA